MVLRSTGPIFYWSRGPLQYKNITSLNSRRPFGDPLALQGSTCYGFVIASYASIFQSMFASFVDRYWTNLKHVVSMLLRLSHPFSMFDFASILDPLFLFGTSESQKVWFN